MEKTGTVKWFNEQKGFGFIQPADGGADIFVHISAVEKSGMRTLREGQKVTFDAQTDPKKGKLSYGALAEEAKKEEKKADLIQKLICHGPHEKRTLEINANGKGCVLLYNKQNESKEVARAMNNVEPCKSAMEKIRTRLESGNFACE